jgi:hypothetical protein
MAGAGADERWSLVWEVRWNFDSAKRGWRHHIEYCESFEDKTKITVILSE